jgi:hypothetical protein
MEVTIEDLHEVTNPAVATDAHATHGYDGDIVTQDCAGSDRDDCVLAAGLEEDVACPVSGSVRVPEDDALRKF